MRTEPVGEKIDSGLPFGTQMYKPTPIGTLNAKPLTKEAVKDLAEYLWLIRFYNLGGAKVLSSQVREDSALLMVTLHTTRTVYGDFGLKDEITVLAENYWVNPRDGAVRHSQHVVKKLTGKGN